MSFVAQRLRSLLRRLGTSLTGAPSGNPPAPLWRRAAPAAGYCALAGLVVTLGLTIGKEYAASKIQLDGSGAWVTSIDGGQVALIDGDTAELAATVDLPADVKGPFNVVQSGNDAYVVDTTTGRVIRIDGGTLKLTPAPTQLLDPGQHANFFAGHNAVYAIDSRGVLKVADPETLRLRHSASLNIDITEPGRQSVVDPRGNVWLLDQGNVVRVDDQGKQQQSKVKASGGTLMLSAGRVVVADPVGRSATLLHADNGSADGTTCMDIAAGDDTLRFSGSPTDLRVYAVSGRQDVLRISDLRTGACHAPPIQLGTDDPHLGPATEAAGHLFIPDFDKGIVLIADPRHPNSPPVKTKPLIVPTDRKFELFARGDYVFYNDPISNQAGVVRVDGTFTAVQKYGKDNKVRKGRHTSTSTPTDTKTPTSTATSTPTGSSTGSASSSPSGTPSTGAGNCSTVDVAALPQVKLNEEATLQAVAVGGRQLQSVRWDFGDGVQETGSPVHHVWHKAQPYVVTVEASFADGSHGRCGRAIQVVGENAPLQALFSADKTTVEAGDGVNFADSSTGDPESWQWQFSSSTGTTTFNGQKPPSQKWSQTGQVEVRLTVTREQRTSQSPAVIITVIPKTVAPEAAFQPSATTVRQGDCLTFTDQSSGPPLTWQWDFGTGEGSGEQNPTYCAWQDVGTKTVTLTVSNDKGTSSPASQQIEVTPAVIVQNITWNPNPADDEHAVALSAQVTAVDTPLVYDWNVVDQQDPSNNRSSSEVSPRLNLDAATYTVTLTVTDAKARTGSTSTALSVNVLPDPPHADFNFSGVRSAAGSCAWTADPGDTISLTSTSGGNYDHLEWTLNGGQMQTGENAAYLLGSAQDYSIKLTAVAKRRSDPNDTKVLQVCLRLANQQLGRGSESGSITGANGTFVFAQGEQEPQGCRVLGATLTLDGKNYVPVASTDQLGDGLSDNGNYGATMTGWGVGGESKEVSVAWWYHIGFASRFEVELHLSGASC